MPTKQRRVYDLEKETPSANGSHVPGTYSGVVDHIRSVLAAEWAQIWTQLAIHGGEVTDLRWTRSMHRKAPRLGQCQAIILSSPRSAVTGALISGNPTNSRSVLSCRSTIEASSSILPFLLPSKPLDLSYRLGTAQRILDIYDRSRSSGRFFPPKSLSGSSTSYMQTRRRSSPAVQFAMNGIRRADTTSALCSQFGLLP
jgi:hypothetical protein